MPRLYKETVVPLPLEEAFRFFENPLNLQAITPPRLNLVVLNEGEIEMKKGATFRYRIKLFGIPLTWVTLIPDYDPPNSFVDIQVKGPYKKWVHTHRFERCGPSGEQTLITDDVEYELPFGILGSFAHWAWVRHDLSRIFAYREKRIRELLHVGNSGK